MTAWEAAGSGLCGFRRASDAREAALARAGAWTAVASIADTLSVVYGTGNTSYTHSAALVLDLDEELGSGIGTEEWEHARGACHGEIVHVPRGVWEPPAAEAAPDGLVALVIVGGLICREVALQDRHLLELLGSGDVLQLPEQAEQPSLASTARLVAVSDTVLLALGRPFVRAAARWPRLLMNLHLRLERQRERLAVQGLIAHLPRAEHRLLVMLRHLADRWGRVIPEGTVVPLTLTHELLGQLIAARRPTVTLAVKTLEQDGVIGRLDDGSWLLTADADPRVRALTSPGHAAPAVATTLTLHDRASALRREATAVRAQARQTLHRMATVGASAEDRGPLTPREAPDAAKRLYDHRVSERIQNSAKERAKTAKAREQNALRRADASRARGDDLSARVHEQSARKQAAAAARAAEDLVEIDRQVERDQLEESGTRERRS